MNRNLKNLANCIFITLTLTIMIGSLSGCGEDAVEEKWGARRLATFGTTPVFSTDGSKIAFGGDDGNSSGIWIYDFSSGLDILVEMSHNYDYAWAPDSDTLAFSNSSGGVDRGLWIVDLEGNLTNLYDNGRFPTWSPDGSEIAFQDGIGSGIYRIPSTGGTPELISPVGETPRWSPTGDYIAYVIRQTGNGLLDSLYLWDSSTGISSVLVAGGPNFDWSPDGASIAFERYEQVGSSGYAFNVKVVDIDSPSPVVLWPGGEYPRWSPNGAKIALEANAGDVADGIFIISPDGGSPEEIVASGFEPSFGASENEMAYFNNNGVFLATKN